MSRFEGQAAIVTGAASGIGAASAARLAQEGARVLLADVNADALEQVAAGIDGAEIAVTDVAAPEANAAMVQTALDAFGRLDVVHLNAGVAPFGGVLDIEVDAWDRVMGINLRGVFLGIRACAPVMPEGGAIVCTASVAGRRGIPSTVAYATSKHGVLGLVKASAIDLAPRRIRINAICPGTIDTPIIGPAHANEEYQQALTPLQAMRRLGRPEEIAAVAAFLLSDDASFMTGEAITADGGQANLLHLALTDDFMTGLSA